MGGVEVGKKVLRGRRRREGEWEREKVKFV